MRGKNRLDWLGEGVGVCVFTSMEVTWRIEVSDPERCLYMPQQQFKWKKLSRAIRLSIYVRCDKCELCECHAHSLCGGILLIPCVAIVGLVQFLRYLIRVAKLRSCRVTGNSLIRRD